MINEIYIKLIFGLKIKQFRTEKKMSLTELAAESGMSVSYLNEIETGKKYPKTDKIVALSDALDTSYDKLVSLKLAKNLAPIGELLESNILEQLPLDHYGIDINKLILLVANSPIQLSALIATLIEVAQNSEQSKNNFSKTALRIFKEFNENYFEDLENEAERFLKEFNISPVPFIKYAELKTILEESYSYKIDRSGINKFPELSELRAVTIKNHRHVLLMNNKLSDAQMAFIAGKELAYNYLKIKDRSYVHSSLRLKTFDQLLNNFKASYFATAILINRNLLAADLDKFFKEDKWNGDEFLKILDKYNCTTEMFFQRITNLSSKYFGLNKFFFFRFNHVIGTNEYNLSNELKLNARRNPGANSGSENFCRRWISFKTLKELENLIKEDNNYSGRIAKICHSQFFDSHDEFLCFSVGQRGNLFDDMVSSITLGFQYEKNPNETIKFAENPEIPFITVNETCERCNVQNCKERTAPPSNAVRIEKFNTIEKTLQKLNTLYKN